MGASISVGVRPANSHPSAADLLVRRCRPADAAQDVPGVRNLRLVAGSPSLAGIDSLLRNVRQPEQRLADCIRPLAATYDDVVVDSPSNFTILSQSVSLLAEHLIVPLRADYLSLESLAHFLRWYRDRRPGRDALARVSGILLTMVDYRQEATREIVDIIRMHNRRGVLRTEIPRDPRAAEAPSHGVPLTLYSRSRAARAYEQLTSEILIRVKRLHAKRQVL